MSAQPEPEMSEVYSCVHGIPIESAARRICEQTRCKHVMKCTHSGHLSWNDAFEAFTAALEAKERELASAKRTIDQEQAIAVQMQQERDTYKAQLDAATRQRDWLQQGYNKARCHIMAFPAVIDWSKRYHELAREFGCDIGAVRNEFVRRFPGKRKHCSSKPISQRKKWKRYRKWDWSKRDAELSEIHNLTRERVRQIRYGLGIPPSRPAVDWNAVDWSKTNDELAAEIKRNPQSVQRHRGALAPETNWEVQKDQFRREICSKISEMEWRTLRKRDLLDRLRSEFPEAPMNWVLAWKKEHGYFRPSRWDAEERYAGIDWGRMSFGEIANRVGVSAGAVAMWGRRHGLIPLPITRKEAA